MRWRRAGAASVDMAVQVGSVRLRNPVMTASGTAGHGAELGRYLDLGELGAVVVKSLAAFEWPGNPAPRLAPVRGGMLNAVGLQGPGVSGWISGPMRDLLASGATVVASIWGRSVEEYAEAARLLAAAPADVVAVEVNLSCPNLEERIIAHDAVLSAAVMAATEVSGRPRWAKLSPNSERVVEVAAAVVNAGAEAVTLINTVQGRAIEPVSAEPALSKGSGGLSGPCIHPVAVRLVHEVHRALPEVPIVGVGGVVDAPSAVELLRAGASAVQVGTASFYDPRAPQQVLRDLARWCARRRIPAVAELGALA